MDYHNNEWENLFTMMMHFLNFFHLRLKVQVCWLTVFKRDGYRKVFEKFSLENVASYTQDDVNRIFESGLVIKSIPKIEAVINNAKLFLQIKKSSVQLITIFWNRSK